MAMIGFLAFCLAPASALRLKRAPRERVSKWVENSCKVRAAMVLTPVERKAILQGPTMGTYAILVFTIIPSTPMCKSMLNLPSIPHVSSRSLPYETLCIQGEEVSEELVCFLATWIELYYEHYFLLETVGTPPPRPMRRAGRRAGRRIDRLPIRATRRSQRPLPERMKLFDQTLWSMQ